MQSSFNNIVTDKATRNFGGTIKGIAEPYISGYHFIHFDSLPVPLTKSLSKSFNHSGVTNNGDAGSVLEASCLGVTPPGGTLNKTTFNGLGNTKWHVPTSIDYGDSISIKFLEYSHLPVSTIIHAWVKMIRDYRNGTSSLIDGEYQKKNYASTMYYWTTKPDGITVEYAACYTGVFPTKDPQDLFSGDLSSIDKLEIDIDFSLDYVWHEPWVLERCNDLSKDRRKMIVDRNDLRT